MGNYLRYHYIKTPKEIRKYNQKVKDNVYSSLSDDEFYKLIKPIENEVNKFAKRRLREIEYKRYGTNNQGISTGCLLIIFCVLVLIIILVLFSI